jgi:tRNA dimethylallyltransferase
LKLASLLNAEILSMDSMLVYQGMDLGTAKPSKEQRAEIPHHLLDLVKPVEEFSVARWLKFAEVAESRLHLRGKSALFVGGTNLYLKALTGGLMDGPDIPDTVQSELQVQSETKEGRAALFDELQRVDPPSAQKLHPNDLRRILRALEVFRASGRPHSSWQEQWGTKRTLGVPAVALHWPREVLRTRVSERFHQMLAAGFVEEVQQIKDSEGYSPTASKALGYAQILSYLAGECTLEEATQKAITLTRTYIRRQMTWLRSFSDLKWLSVEKGQTAAFLAQQVAILFREKST